MKGIVKKLISTIAAAAVALTVVTLPAAPGSVAVAETSENCTGDHSGMIAWIHEDYLPTSGNYYLDTDVNLSPCSYTGSLILCLNGHTITAASGKQIFSVSGSLTLCDCSSGKTGTLTGANVSSSGGAVDVNSGGTFTMNGGAISGNTAGSGGGVYVRSGGSFIMNGGTISNNITDSSGGGVYSSGVFTMNGGTISGNTTNSNAGGGVFVASSGTFTMNGGMITSNTADIRGGGVYVLGTFTMSGGTISGNTTAEFGGGVGNKGTFEINGKVNISGNTKTDGSDNNVCLLEGKNISIGNGFNTSSTIGVNTQTTATCSSYIDVTETSPKDINGCFTADKDDEFVFWEASENKIKLTKKHTIENPDIVEPTCTEPGTEKGTCTVCTQTVTKTTPALGHSWGEWQTTTAPTATEKGEETRTCNNDGTHTETREIPATGGGNTGDNGNSGNTGDNGNSGNTGDNGNNSNTEDNGNNSNTEDNGNNSNTESNNGNSGNSNNSESSSGGSSGSGSGSTTQTTSIAEVEQDEKSPETELANSDSELKDALLTEEELANADNITIVLRVKDEDPGEDRQTIETRLASTDGFKVGQYIDVSLFKIINGSESKLTSTNKPIKVRFEIPQELRADGRTFAVIRVHDGKTTILADIDGDRDTITIETDKFSTYALIYSDSPTAGNPYTGTASAIFPTALLAAAAMLISKRRK